MHVELGDLPHVLLFSQVLASALLPRLDGDERRNLRLACKGMRDAVDGSVDRVTVLCREACLAGGAPPRAGPLGEHRAQGPTGIRGPRMAALQKLYEHAKLTHLVLRAQCMVETCAWPASLHQHAC